MKKALASGVDLNYWDLSKITFPRMKEWARHEGFDFRELEIQDSQQHPSWQKILWVLWLLQEYDLVFWMDADVVIRDLEFCLSDLDSSGLTFSMDLCGICCGAFSSGREGIPVLEAVEAIRKLNPPFRKYEQDAMKLLMPWGLHDFQTIPQQVISNPQSGFTGVFAHHLWANGYRQKEDLILDAVKFTTKP